MNGLPWFDGVFYHHFALTLLHSLWQGLLLAAFGVVACHCLAGRSATARYRVWTTTLLLMVMCLPATFVWLSQDSTVHVPAATESVFVSPTHNIASGSTNAVRHGTEPASLTARIGPWTTWLYLVGLCFMLARTFLGLLATKRLRREASPLPESPFLESIRSHARRLALRGMPLVAYCERVAVPSLVGLWRSMILLPPALATGLTPQQLEMVVLHELVHLSRRDNLWIVVQRVSEAILFFHPAAWYVSRRVSIERELRCDEIVVDMTRASDYAESLLRVAELIGNTAAAIPVGAAMASPREGKAVFMHRILRILGESKLSPVRLLRLGPVLVVSAIAAVAIVLVVWGPFAKATDSETASAIAMARAMVDQKLLLIHWEALDTPDPAWRAQADELVSSFANSLPEPHPLAHVFHPDLPQDRGEIDSVDQMLLAAISPEEDEIYHRTSSGTLRYIKRIRAQKGCVGVCHVRTGLVFANPEFPSPGAPVEVGDVLAIVSVEVRPDSKPVPRAVP